MLKAVIFDMDGVIIDSEPMHAKAALLAIKKYNVEITMDYINNFIGSTTYSMCLRMVKDFNLTVPPEELLKANNEMKKYLLVTEGHTIVPYVIELIKNLYDNGIKLSIASSSSCEEIEEVMNSLDIKKYINEYVSGTSVAHPKPAPDIFLEAARRLEVEPEECFVIEDSYHGVTAASAAGITCIGYVNPNSGNQNLENAAILVEGFEEVDYAFLNQFYQECNASIAILSTDQLIVKELAVSDISELYQIYQQPTIREFLDDFTDNLYLEQEKHKAYIKNVYRFYGYGLWGVFLKDNGQLIGRCGIEYKMLGQEEIYEIGYLLSTAYQGMGYAHKFVLEIINYSFTKLDIPRIVAVIDKSNLRSIQLAEKVGMQCYGECVRNQRNCYTYEITQLP